MLRVLQLAVAGWVVAAETATGTGESYAAENCLFLHGLGVKGIGEPLFMHKLYWEELKPVAAKLCRNTFYPVFDTVTRGAGNASLQDDFFNYAVRFQGEHDRVFAHSMGNNILARACLDQGKCLTRGWFNAHGPLTGSQVPNDLVEWCPSDLHPNGTFPGRMAGLAADLVGYCGKGTFSLTTCGHPASESVCGNSSAASDGVAQLAVVGQLTRHGTMCGTSGWGLTSLMSVGLEALDRLIMRPGGAGQNDGMVSLDSCSAAIRVLNNGTAAAGFTAQSSSRYYVADTNHGDGMGYTKDGTESKQQPLTWYSQMIRLGWLA